MTLSFSASFASNASILLWSMASRLSWVRCRRSGSKAVAMFSSKCRCQPYNTLGWISYSSHRS